jgi:hypothetical protein
VEKRAPRAPSLVRAPSQASYRASTIELARISSEVIDAGLYLPLNEKGQHDQVKTRHEFGEHPLATAV